MPYKEYAFSTMKIKKVSVHQSFTVLENLLMYMVYM